MAVSLSTRLGDIKIELFCEDEPDAARNFLALCASGFYNGKKFHRVIANFLIQCGDDNGTGDGGQSPFGSVTVIPNDVFSDPWIIGYADEGEVKSQFFITVRAHRHLNGRFCGFGKVIHGMNVVQSISRIPTLPDNYPISPVAITNTHIHYNPFA